jgi:hypothetical protein
MAPSSRISLLAGVLLLAVGGCAQVNTALDVVFPATVPGLPADSWQSMPVRRWLTGDGIEPLAISACFAHACREPALAGLFRVGGREAVSARRVITDPRALQAELRPRRPSRHGVTVAVERTGEGLSVRMNRGDGRRPAGGHATFVERDGWTLIVLTVATTEEKARALAAGIAAAL